jgi:predicted HTH transcriptional regulator
MSIARETSDLLARLRLGEDSTLELKRITFTASKVDGPKTAHVADEVASLANSIGGDLLLGIDDQTRQPIGLTIDQLDVVEAWFANAIESHCDPTPTLHVRRIELPNAGGELLPVLWIQVPKSLFVHRSPSGYMHRVGSTKRQLSPDQLQRLFAQRSRAGLIQYDESPVPGCEMHRLSNDLARRFLGGGPDPDEIKLRKMKILTLDQGVWVASVAGCLLCAERPRDWLPTAFVQCVRYLGTERTADQQHDAMNAEGPLDAQIVDAVKFVLRNMHVGARKEIGRVDYPQYAPAAVFEAIANAVAHRDYSLPGSPIRVHQFADRLEIDTPGALPNSQTIDTLPYKQATRNELVVSLLTRCPVDLPGLPRRTLMDRRGEGVPLLIAASRELSGRAPEYALIGPDMLKLTIHAASPPQVREGGPERFARGGYGSAPYGAGPYDGETQDDDAP